MADFIISPYAVSFNSIKTCLQQYIQNKANVTWTDFYTSGAGETLVELNAAVAAFYAFHFIIGRRESYLPTAQNYASVIGGAQTLAYSASRGNNLHLYIDIIPMSTQTLSKWSIIGSYAEYDVVLFEQAILNAGEKTTLHCVIGNSAVQQYDISSSDLQQFTFTAANSTDDCRLILNTTEVPSTTKIQEAIEDKWVMITNSFGAIDCFYWQQGDYSYKGYDTLYFHYIERNNIKFGAFNPSNLTIEVAQEIGDVKVHTDYQDPEDIEHVRTAAPLAHETNSVVRGRKDYAKYLKILNRNIIDVNDMDINPGLIALTYLKSKTASEITSLLTEQEKQEYIKSIVSMCPDGVAKAFIEDPVRVVRSLQITLQPISGQNISADISSLINEILNNYRNKLQPNLDLEEIEHEIENLPGVKIARVSVGSQEYQLNTRYNLYGNELQTWTMYCAQIQTKSGNTEPDWSTAGNVGDTIIDNNLVWENSNKYMNTVAGKWNANGDYSLFSDVSVGYSIQPNCTSFTQPVWGEDIIVDGNVSSTLSKTYSPKINEWLPNQKYTINDCMTHKTDEQIVVYRAKETHKYSSKQKPKFTEVALVDSTIEDNALTWTYRYDSWKPLYSYVDGDIIAHENNDKLYVYRCNTYGKSGLKDDIFNGDQIVYDKDKEEQQILLTWELINTLEAPKDWVASTEFNYGAWIKADYTYEYTDTTELETQNKQKTVYKFFECTDFTNSKSGDVEPTWKDDEDLDGDGKILNQEIIDNNITWVIDTFEIPQQGEFQCVGKEWQANTEFQEGDNIIASDGIYTYLYRVYYTNPITVSVSNKIYSVVDYSGTSGEVEPIWGETNVVDNDILWTKTENESTLVWEPNHQFRFGTIISTDQGFYTFSSIIGMSGDKQPNWAGISNNVVQDGVITWVRINNSTSLPLQWNEYLELDFTVRIVS